MKRAALPGTDLIVSRLGFGTASLHHIPTSRGRQALLADATALGFSHFDASPYYGFGVAEHELGRFLRGRGDEVTVATKVGLYPAGGGTASATLAWGRKLAGRLLPALSRVVVDWSVAVAERSLAQSLRTLGRERVDIVFLHEPAPGLLDADEFLSWLAQRRRAGSLRYWGLAGPLAGFAAWASHPLAEILQVRDADLPDLMRAGREPQLSFGALRSASQGFSAEAIRSALARNPNGSLLVSTRKPEHLRDLVHAAK